MSQPPNVSRPPIGLDAIDSAPPEGIDWTAAAADLDRDGYAVLPRLLDPATCSDLRGAFDNDDAFRSTVDMGRYNFGEGRYRYYRYPLPAVVAQLRSRLYPPLAAIANEWAERLGQPPDWPSSPDALLRRCHEEGQRRPTPLILRYRQGDYNCLHQDLYGAVHFPLQVIFMLSEPGRDFEGGELILVEQRPRLQSRPMVIALAQGAGAIIPVKERPRTSIRGWSRSQMRHGVSRVRTGERMTLGIIFHDAA